MKTLLVLISFAAFVGCKKCKDCTTTVTTTMNGQSSTETADLGEVCDDDLDEAESHNKTYTIGNATITEKTVCK